MNKAYKCRLYPNKRQAALIELTFAACRWVYNMALETKRASYEVNKKTLSYYDLSKMLPIWKQTNGWLKDVPSQALIYSLRDLDAAYQNFFRRVKAGDKPGYPKFKSRHDGTQSYKDKATIRVVDESHVVLAKLGTVRCRITQPIEGRILNATVSRVPSGKYFVSICCADVPAPEMPMGSNDVLGIDAGVKDLMTRSDGTKVPNHRFLERSARKLRREQRRLSRKKKGSANWRKQKRRVAVVYEKAANQRRDATHKATTQAIRDSKAIAVEDLNVRGMTKNRHLAKAVSDAGMSEMIRQLEYKCDWYGRGFAKVDRWYPSSKTCSECGHVFDGLTLSMRKWTCPKCGARHDRDLNAAKNIAREGARLLSEERQGDGNQIHKFV